MQEPLETAELLAFAKTVEVQSLSRAAKELGVPRATVSRRLARLEERLNTRLLRRTTRSLVLTDAGEALYRHARIVLAAVGDAENSVRRTDDAVRGDLRISVPPMLHDAFYEMICGFAQRYPELRLHLHFSSAHVDLRRDGYDVAIRASSTLEPGLVARTLIRIPLVAVASPTYLAERGTPSSRRDLSKHRCLLGFARGELPETHWPLLNGGKLHVESSFLSNEVTLLCAAAVRGLGIALLPLVLVRDLLEAGALRQVLADEVGADSQVAVVYLEREFVPPQVRAFVDTVVGWAAKGLTNGLLTPQLTAAAARPVDGAPPLRKLKASPRAKPREKQPARR
jgi:DNA-binding transcriptional LysR family regulator